MGKYSSIFLRSAAYFGSPMSVAFGMSARSLTTGVVAGAAAGLLFGGSMALLTYLADRSNRASGKAVGNGAVHQQREISLPIPADEAFQKAKAAVLATRAKILRESPGEGSLEAEVPWSWKSFGEIVTIRALASSPTMSTVQVSSRPRLPTTAVDYGRNFDNVEAIVGHMLAATQA